MARRGGLVNLDAMIVRADFAATETDDPAIASVGDISLRDFSPGALIGPRLRKPDFQRETNHWSSEQVVSLLECYVNGDLIPSVILWKSPQYLFVIDGGHRLSVLRAWIEDDFGDGPISQPFFGFQIAREQIAAAKATRELVHRRLGSWKQLQSMLDEEGAPPEAKRRATVAVTRALPIQWVLGNADRAESSFFKINTEGTPLDEIEELLLRNRLRPIPVAARAVIRAGKGHRYWSAFAEDAAHVVERSAEDLHRVLFEPEVRRPIKTIDLPLGGSKGVRAALQVLIDFMLIAIRDQQGVPKEVGDQPEDGTGEATKDVLRRSLRLARRMTGNDGGSLGLHPAVYYYGPTGRHSGPMFMGTATLLARSLVNNDATFFPKFTRVRERLEGVLVAQKDLIATIVQKQPSKRRTGTYATLLKELVDRIDAGQEVAEEWMIEVAGLRGKIVTGGTVTTSNKFSDETKSQVFISTALKSAPRCPVCSGYLDPEKSLSYDHVERVREGGIGTADNLQLTHPYCNQSVRS